MSLPKNDEIALVKQVADVFGVRVHLMGDWMEWSPGVWHRPVVDIDDAFDALDKFCATHGAFEILTRTGDNMWRCEILGHGRNSNLHVQACGETRAIAICEAIVAAAKRLGEAEKNTCPESNHGA